MEKAQPKQQSTKTNMGIAIEDIETIKPYVITWIKEAHAQQSQPQNNFDRELFERGIRVEEELKAQRDIIQQGFSQMDKRFEQVDKRFEQIDKRFEQVDKRFEQVDKRFELVDKRFEQVDLRFEKLFQNLRWSIGAFIAFWGVSLASFQYILS